MSRIKKTLLKENLIHNIKTIVAEAKDKEIIWMIKSNAYGQGVKEILPVLLENKQYNFGLYDLEEVIKIDKIVTNCTLYILDGLTKSEWTRINSNSIFRNNIVICLNKTSDIDKIININKNNIRFHAFFETGFNWYGIDDIDQFILTAIKNNLKLEGVCTHLADGANENSEISIKQIANFNTIISIVKKYYPNIKTYLCNSDSYTKKTHSMHDLVRIGRALYGGVDNLSKYKQVIKIEAEILQVKYVKAGDFIGYGATFQAIKDIKIAIVCFGYNDGCDRRISNNGFFAVKGKLCKVVGRVAMNITIIDVTGIEVREGDYATYTDDIEGIRYCDIANRIGCLDYELMVRMD